MQTCESPPLLQPVCHALSLPCLSLDSKSKRKSMNISAVFLFKYRNTVSSKRGRVWPGRRLKLLGTQVGSEQGDRLINVPTYMHTCVLITEADILKHRVHLIYVNLTF